MDSVEVAKAVSSLPLTVLLVLVLVGGYVEWWIYGSIHRARVADLERQLSKSEQEAAKWEAKYLEQVQMMSEMAIRRWPRENMKRHVGEGA